MIKTFPKTHLIAAAGISLVVGSAMMFSPSSDVEAKRMVVTLDTHRSQSPSAVEPAPEKSEPLPQPVATAQEIPASSPPEPVTLAEEPATAAPVAEVAEPVPAEPDWEEFRIKSGDTLSSLFRKAGFNDGLMLSVIHGEGEATKLQRLYAGETLAFATSENGELEAIRLDRNRLESLLIERTEDGFHGKTVTKVPEPQVAFASGEIEGSLYLAGKQAGLDDRITMELAGIFGWDIDFVYDIRRGDSFEVVYEELFLDGEKIGDGKILAARFVNRGREIVALHYSDSSGDTDYYTPDGNSMRKAFLRTPINARVSSPFNLQRRHPVLDVVRPHEGTDYAAPVGTPIKAAGDGRVSFAGWKGGYGRTVVLQHGDNISTLYAHMSKLGRGIKNGQRVKQGETIGYVGASGMVTGPHLHYEFRVNGVARNSRTIDLPEASPVPATELARFKSATQQLVGQLNTLGEGFRQIAMAEDASSQDD
ncbi:Murein DD-endopeptidase MepM and murein hydrolase activator NlpD, contain LysM domain [Marinobacter daqiaonensis]|uniref:Murein DD-endopeptidase MepM and murein hydrolase activator NlpD, contain LysM domain n=1 Tax=Marinobacter daqiaonensis TaxID=650891 RepID=A0A1I6JWZ7_9GAMM|nr:peptidoglycan DD-metalloendopeptidase family protein [Marinobacter daqiaonensis]SFR83505.1 Murein DD-endopeptidase MepM and murein hydrolase activator NlpD, contain LysM domain [Marinobacter daqiaonensis]